MFTFTAMTTEIRVVVPHVDEGEERRLAACVVARFERSEQTFSRFREQSELSAWNRAPGTFEPSEELRGALWRAARYESLTGGLFSARVGATLRAQGYDRSFAPGALDRDEPPASAPRSAGEIDLGGMIKGWTVDRAAEELPAGSAVDAGGDMRLGGGGPDGTGWLVDVEDPRDARATLITLRVRDAAVATSAPNRRTWRRGAARTHHLIDPRTGAASESDLAQVTVVASSAERADVMAKAAFVAGRARGRALLEAVGLGGVFVMRDGDVALVGRLEVAHG